MKYCEMIKFLNDNGILLMQPVIADMVDSQLPIGVDISENKFEEICESVFNKFLESDFNSDTNVYDLVEEELTNRGYKEC